ncbi:hypothetical protein COB52_03380 [Candidatus Kaiserbacteria bacterium]|nr:MAG: hypothetical protein COB52_03380 [Candidatus Kaiserbacteria bacterium]
MKENRKILILVTQGIVGGTSTFLLELTQSLIDAGEDITLAYGSGEYIKERSTELNLKNIHLKWMGRTVNPLKGLMSFLEVRAVLKREKYSVIHLNSSNALIAGIAAKTIIRGPRVVFTVHGLSFLDKNADVSNLLKWAYGLGMRFLLLFVDRIVFVSNENYTRAKQKGIVKNGHVIRNGLKDPTFLSREEARKELSLGNGFIIGSIGRLVSQKNYEFLISQAENFPNAEVIIIGEGKERGKLEKLIKGNVSLLGEIQNASRYLKAFDVFVLPSRYEGFSISLLEALFAGIPVLVSDVGGAQEILSDTNQIFPFNNAEAFNSKCRRIIESEDYRESLGLSNYESSRKFSIEKAAEEYIKVYRT